MGKDQNVPESDFPAMERSNREKVHVIACGAIAREILAVNEQDPRDRKLLSDHTRRVSKALRILKQENGVCDSFSRAGYVNWRSKFNLT